MAQHLHTNRLIHEKSPYLLQHAHNPVDWYPWGSEAFKTAQDQNKPIFLSIGYATCHWCHVMEQESFESEEIAQIMNQTFVNIKVDREEHPDVDSLYMEFAQAMMSGGAGWPLNIILTSELKPFFAATYLPPEGRKSFLGLKQLTLRIKQIWDNYEEKEKIVSQAGRIVDVFASNIHFEGAELPQKEQIKEAAELLFKIADPINGGTKGAPKFPIGYQANFLLRITKASSDSRALFYVERTLDMMHRGGIYDHLGGGFSRYSIDEHWLIPHFEKMLYDNAILARAYLESWELTRQNFFRETCEHILTYILRDMTDEQGGFYSAEDADSDGREGMFYTWGWQEIHDLLETKAPLFCQFYAITPTGNFEGRNILHTPLRYEEFAAKHQLDPVIVVNQLKEMRQKLWEEREKRVHPNKDDKILCAWNGLMIYSLAEAGRVFNNSYYINAAVKAAQFIRKKMFKEGGLLRRWRQEDARYDGCLDDYAFYIHGILSLFEVDQGAEWLNLAIQLSEILQKEFKSENGAFYINNGKDPSILIRRCEFYDGAEPSGNAVHCENLLRLHQITGKLEYLDQAEDIMKAAKQHIDMYPPGACYHLMALQRYLDKNAPTIIIALNKEEQYKAEIASMLAGSFIPHKAVIWKHWQDRHLLEVLPHIHDQIPANDKTTVYICHGNKCDAPLNDLSKVREAFERL